MTEDRNLERTIGFITSNMNKHERLHHGDLRKEMSFKEAAEKDKVGRRESQLGRQRETETERET